MNDDRPFIDRYGRRHSAAIFDHWHERVIKIMGIRRCTPAELEAQDKPKETGKAVAA